MPAISIIIPVYNAEKYLRKCLDSVINQTFADLEIICVNDCSQDGSLKILREYEAKDLRITVIDCKQNNRQAVARNIGMKAASGKYLAFVDNDDWLDLDRFEKLYGKAEAEDADIVLAGYVCEYEDGCVQYVNRLVPKNCVLDGQSFIHEFVAARIVANSPWHGMYRRSLIERAGIHFLSVRAEDYVFNLEAYVRAGKVCVLSDCSYHFRALDVSDSRGGIYDAKSLYNVAGLERCIDALRGNAFLHEAIDDFTTVIDKLALVEFCAIIIGACSVPSNRSLSERCSLLRQIIRNGYFIEAYRNSQALRALRRKHLLLIKILLQNIPVVVCALLLRSWLKHLFFTVKNQVYRWRRESAESFFSKTAGKRVKAPGTNAEDE